MAAFAAAAWYKLHLSQRAESYVTVFVAVPVYHTPDRISRFAIRNFAAFFVMSLTSSEKNPAKSEKDEFLALFWKLSKPEDEARLLACEKISSHLLKKQTQHQVDSGEIWCPDVKYAFGRLISGLASERKASRLGFSCALTHLTTRLNISDDVTIQKLLSMIEDNLRVSKDKVGEKGILLGKVFAFLAVVRSCKFDNAPKAVKIAFEALMKYSSLKSYLRPICFHGIKELIQKIPNSIFDDVLWKRISELLSEGWEKCDADVFEILQTCCKHQSDTCGKTFLKTNNWISQKSKKSALIGNMHIAVSAVPHDTDKINPKRHCGLCDIHNINAAIKAKVHFERMPDSSLWGGSYDSQSTTANFSMQFGSHSYKYLGKMLPSTTLCHPRIHSLCYEIIENVVKSDNETLRKFWKDAIDTGLLESSPERKYLAFKLSIHALPLLEDDQISTVWSTRLITSLFYVLSHKANPLHAVCKTEIINDLAESVRSEKMTTKKQLTLLFQLLTSPAGLFLDENTNTRCVQAVCGSLNIEAVKKYVDWLKSVFVTGKLNYEGIKEVSLDTARRWSMSQLSQLIRNSRLPRQDEWLLSAIRFLFLHYHFDPKSSQKCKIMEFNGIDKSFTPMTEKTREHVKHCLEPALNAMNIMPSLQDSDKKVAQRHRFNGTASDGEFWIYKLIKFADELMEKYKVKLITSMDDKSQELWEEMINKMEDIINVEGADDSRIAEGTALRLLLSHVGIRLLNSSSEENSSAHEVLLDLFQVADERFNQQKDVQALPEDLNWVEVIIETILSMLSQNSHSIRSVADQVFKLLSAQLTRKGLQLILDVLDPAKGKEVLEEDNDEDAENEEEGDEEEDDEEIESSDSDDSGLDQDEIMSDEIKEEDDNVHDQFREKVKKALGDAAAESSEEEDVDVKEEEEDSDSGPEMDDDAMMRIDNVLAEVFRQKKLSKRKLEKDSHKQLLIFQLRCLDLIEIMANRRHHEPEVPDSDSLILEAVRPLLVTIQNASRNASDMTLAEKASVLLRVKICRMKRYPKNLSKETISSCHDDIDAMLGIAQKAQSVFMCQLASDCCLFLLRVLSGNGQKEGIDTPTGVVDVSRINKIYKAALENFMTHRESRLQPCVIQDFITRFPVLACDLATDLVKYIKDGVQVYRRSRACFMLHELLKTDVGKEKCKALLFQLVSVTNELTEKASSSGDLKTKHFVEVMRLYHQAITVLQSTDKLKSLNKTVLIESLHKFVEMQEVVKSQELTNWTWKVLYGLGVERDSSKMNKKKAKKRRRKESENETKNEEGSKNESEEQGEDQTVKTESKKEMKARVLKEKKERRKNKKKSEEDVDKTTDEPNSSDGAKKKSKKKKKKTQKNAKQGADS